MVERKTQITPYQLVKKRVKNISIRIREGKVLVTAPYFVTKKELDKIMMKKAEWINQTLEKEKKDRQITISQEQEKEFYETVKTSIDKYTKLTGLYPKQVRIKKIHYAWGSCSSKGNISINSKLAAKSKEAADYVVLHELCHLQYMNHSKAFWKKIESYLPNYKEIQKELKD